MRRAALLLFNIKSSYLFNSMVIENVLGYKRIYPLQKKLGGWIMKSLKKMIDDFLKRLAAQNKEQFGDEKLDCCKVGRPKQKDK